MSDNLLSRNTVLSHRSFLIYCTISTCSCHGLVLLFDFFRVFCLIMWQLNWAGSENQMCSPQAPPVTSVRLWELLVWNPGPWAAGAMPFRYVSNSINIVLFGFKKTVVMLLFPGTITPLCGTFIVMCRPKGFLCRFGLKTVTVFARFGISRHIPTKIPRCTPGAFLCRHATLECCVTTPKKAS